MTSKLRVDNRKDILLLLLYSPGIDSAVNEPIVGRTRLMKMLYLFRKEALHKFRKGIKVDENNFYEFFPWNFGPFSKEVYDDLTFFVLRRFIEAKPAEAESMSESAEEWRNWVLQSGLDFGIEQDEEFVEEQFSLTPHGEKFTRERLYDALSDAQRALLKEFKARLVQKPLRSILRYVYTEYPESTAKSTIKDAVLGG